MKNKDKEPLPGVGGVKDTPKYREIAENYKIAEDYAVSVKCGVCGAWEYHDAHSKQALLINQNPGAANGWVCRVCYRRAQEPEEVPNPQDIIQERIRYGQSWNLAVAFVASYANLGDSAEQEMEKWQKYFYDKLTNRKP